jgi:hypothetical protein
MYYLIKNASFNVCRQGFAQSSVIFFLETAEWILMTFDVGLCKSDITQTLHED